MSRLALVAFMALATSAAAEPADYELDPEHVTVAFLVAHIDYARVLGRFLDVTGTYRFDEATGELSNVDVRVAAQSVSTNHAERDGHLRSDDFLDARAFPEMRFRATRGRRTGERYVDVGTVRGYREAISLLSNERPSCASSSSVIR